MKGYSLFLFLLLVSSAANSQVLVLAFSALTSSADSKLNKKLTGEWIVVKAEIDGKDVFSQFETVRLNFPKCKGKDYKADNCAPVEVTGDDNTDYFMGLFGDDPKINIVSRKEINKAAKSEDSEYEKVKYEVITTKNSEFEYSFKYKKGTMYIATVGEDGSESFQLARPPKEKKNK